MVGGGGHVLVKTYDNDLFTCGWNSKGQLGNGTTKSLSLLQQIHTKYYHKKLITNLYCGWEESAIITDTRELFVWGSNLYGQLGQKDRIVTTPIKLELPNNERAVCIRFALKCSIILTLEGSTYALGQLKHFEDLKKTEKYKEVIHNGVKFIKFYEGIQQLACGQNHMVFVLPNEKSVSGFGSNQYGQADRYDLGHRIDKIVAGWKHNGVLLSTGDVLLWGRNTYGQLGRNTGLHINAVKRPIRLVVFEKFEDVCLGAEHGLAVTRQGQIYTFGWNEHGNCGNGGETNKNV